MERRPLTDEDRKTMRRLRREGYTLQSIADQFEVGVQTVSVNTTTYAAQGVEDLSMWELGEDLFTIARQLRADEVFYLWACDSTCRIALTRAPDEGPACGRCGRSLTPVGHLRGLAGVRLSA